MLTQEKIQTPRDRQRAGPSRISSDVKSGIYESLKWPICEGSLSGSFYLKVPNDRVTKPLRDWLKKLGATLMCSYHSAAGNVQAWQWRLPLSQFRSVWRLDSPKTNGCPEESCRCQVALKDPAR